MFALSVTRVLWFGMGVVDELYDGEGVLPSSDGCADFLRRLLPTAPPNDGVSPSGMLGLLLECNRALGHFKTITPSVGTMRGRQCVIACSLCYMCMSKVLATGEEVPIAAHGCQVPLFAYG